MILFIQHCFFRPLGVPHLEKVTLFNTDKNKTIDMTSISGSTVHFHSSFFEDKVSIKTFILIKKKCLVYTLLLLYYTCALMLKLETVSQHFLNYKTAFIYLFLVRI